MTDQQDPITPSPELIEEWIELSRPRKDRSPNPKMIATYAARWGADQELEACCKWLPKLPPWMAKSADDLRKHRRPKPPSLKEQALEALKHAEEGWRPVPADCEIIRRALESLPDDLN
jgi:hypothetical protein